ncbi:Pisatin demethylase [Penicillium subrubescens]|uniref:Pisatin demethylase n=1 Tax=Penicillium subrubescens TaxID=1316194 RepID=A0A1Q5UF98_9EURO|nr:Pisatin demethylase [Penicillium subrubescens]
MAPVYQGAVLDSMFTARDPVYHKSLKSSVAQIFSMTNMKNFEVYADECTQIFMEAMLTLEGQPVDFSMWLQWYAFDVIGAITFQRRFGFTEQRRDVDDMIGKIDIGLQYVKIVGQLPFLIPLLQKGLMSSLAGSDTTAISLRAMIYYIVKNQHVYDKIQREIDEADRNKQLSKFITYEECLKLPYL